MNSRFWLFLIPFALIGCSSVTPQQKAAAVRWKALSEEAPKTKVDASDGISEVEAYVIAADYFATKNWNGCGGVGLPSEELAFWRVPILEGIAGAHTKDLLIDKITGSYTVVSPVKMPNKAPEPTTLLVTPRADARVAPSRVVAHL